MAIKLQAVVTLIMAITNQAWASVVLASVGTDSLDKRALQPDVSAICLSNYTWMDDDKGQSPCVVAAYVQEACIATAWTLPALVEHVHYAVPNETTANFCECSWSSYNLLSACTACQGFDDSIQPWGAWLGGCGSFISESSYFPSDMSYTLPSEASIPFWAASNPRSWTGAKFNVTQAQIINAEGHADLTGTPIQPTKHKSTPAGAIAGGVVGGLAIILLGICFLAIRVARRRRRLETNYVNSSSSKLDLQHMRSMSDSSQIPLKPNGTMMPNGFMSQPLMGPPLMPQVMYNLQNPAPLMPPVAMHAPGMSSMPNVPMNFGGVVTRTVYPSQSASQVHIPAPAIRAPEPTLGRVPVFIPHSTSQLRIPPPDAAGVVSDLTPSAPLGPSARPEIDPPSEEIVTPFVAQRAHRSIRKNIPHASTPSSSHDLSREDLGIPTTRTRMNPPAYSKHPGTGEMQAVGPTAGDDEPGQSNQPLDSAESQEGLDGKDDIESRWYASSDTGHTSEHSAQRSRNHKGSLSDIVAAVRAGIL